MFFHSNMVLCLPSKYQDKLLPHMSTTLLAHIHIWQVSLRCELQSKAEHNRCLQSCLGGSFLWLTWGGVQANYNIFSPRSTPHLPRKGINSGKNSEVNVTQITKGKKPSSTNHPEAAHSDAVITFYMIFCLCLALIQRLVAGSAF